MHRVQLLCQQLIGWKWTASNFRSCLLNGDSKDTSMFSHKVQECRYCFFIKN